MAYHRERVETGRLFAEERFGDVDQRADRRLIRDLQVVRRELLDAGLEMRHAHALIGRSIFVRYLEDREVLKPAYFDRVALANPEWQQLLAIAPQKPDLALGKESRRYDRVLCDRDFVYAFFSQLAEDFNGDMFPRGEEEKEQVTQHHCDLLRGFLLGDANPYQKGLFFWAYDFRIVPIGLISSIYEEFYHSNEVDKHGTHYTPPVLIDYVLSQVLTKERLESCPRIIDPACGSGAFLVEAFRRVVRHRVGQLGRRLEPSELQQILRCQIVGIDINSEAIRVAAFSLYLALLNYQEPPDIQASKRLPYLIHVQGDERDQRHYHILHQADAFGLTSKEVDEIRKRLAGDRKLTGKKDLHDLVDAGPSFDADLGEFDVVVGNPPWFETPRDSQALRWARAFEWPIGDQSYSQLFVARALSLVKAGGLIGLLLHANILFNQRSSSKNFRRAWQNAATIQGVTNFVQVRRLFFEKAIAPFLFITFDPYLPDRHANRGDSGHFVYQSARLTREVERLRSVILTTADRRLVRREDLKSRDYLWKTYWWGSHHDAALLSKLDAEERFGDIVKRGLKDTGLQPGYGFQYGQKEPRAFLSQLQALQSKNLKWYGPLQESWFTKPPLGVKRQPDERLYQGQRLIVVRGIKMPFGVLARLESDNFSFRHTIYGVPLPFLDDRQAKLVVGVFWSALCRYRIFMTSGGWGTWYDQIVPNDILSMPMRMPVSADSRVDRIVSAVDIIRSWGSMASRFDGCTPPSDDPPPASVVDDLNDAVFDLFDFSSPQRDLIRDFEENAWGMVREGSKAGALRPISVPSQPGGGTIRNFDTSGDGYRSIERYIATFLDVWNRELEPTGEFRWRVIRSPDATMMAALFTTQEKGAPIPVMSLSDESDWSEILDRCGRALRQPVSQRVYVDGMVRAVTDTDIIIIKRDEGRLWTRSAAREDAEATLVQVMQMQSMVAAR